MLSDHKLEKTATHFGLTLLETRLGGGGTNKQTCIRTACVLGKIQTGYLPNTTATSCAIFLSPFHIYFISVLGDRHSMCHCKLFTITRSSYHQKSNLEMRKHCKCTDVLQKQTELFNTVMRN